MSRLEELRELAEKATPGPWSQGMIGDRLINEVDCSAAFGLVAVNPDLTDDGAEGVADASFIAAANPETVLALIALVEELSAALDRNQHAFESYVNMRPVRDLDETFVESHAALASAATWMEE